MEAKKVGVYILVLNLQGINEEKKPTCDVHIQEAERTISLKWNNSKCIAPIKYV